MSDSAFTIGGAPLVFSQTGRYLTAGDRMWEIVPGYAAVLKAYREFDQLASAWDEVISAFVLFVAKLGKDDRALIRRSVNGIQQPIGTAEFQ